MLELDGGLCPTAWRLLARARQGLGDLAGAAEACRSEVDAAQYATLAFLSAPQATSDVREILRDACRRHGFLRVDLPEVFAGHTGSPLPDRRLFLDYCHLTTEGIHVAMAAVAAEVLNLSGMIEAEQDWRSLLPRLPSPAISPEAEATARLGAAIHCAHRLLTAGPKRPILEHWIRAALDISPGIAEAMLDFVAARSAPGPAVLTAAQQRNLASPYRLLLQHGWQWDFLDAEMLEAIGSVLGLQDEIARRLLEHHAIREEGTDLSRPPYLWEPLERFYPEVMASEDLPGRAYLRSPWPETGFCLVCDAGRDVALDLTLRVPGRTGQVAVAVNGEEAGTVEAVERWSRSRLRLPKEFLRRGLNRLTLRWPDLPPAGDDPLAPAVERLERGIAADLHPVFGEVFSLIVRLL